jgi:hypothetical protein
VHPQNSAAAVVGVLVTWLRLRLRRAVGGLGGCVPLLPWLVGVRVVGRLLLLVVVVGVALVADVGLLRVAVVVLLLLELLLGCKTATRVIQTTCRFGQCL